MSACRLLRTMRKVWGNGTEPPRIILGYIFFLPPPLPQYSYKNTTYSHTAINARRPYLFDISKTKTNSRMGKNSSFQHTPDTSQNYPQLIVSNVCYHLPFSASSCLGNCCHFLLACLQFQHPCCCP